MQHVFAHYCVFTEGRPGSSAIDSRAIEKRRGHSKRSNAAAMGPKRLCRRSHASPHEIDPLYPNFHPYRGPSLQRDDLLPLRQSSPNPQCPLLLPLHPDRPFSSFPSFSLSRNPSMASRPLQSPPVQALLPPPHRHAGLRQPRAPHAPRLSAQIHRARRRRRRAVRRVASSFPFHSSCGLLNALLDPSALTEQPLPRDSVEVGPKNRGDAKELRKELAHSLHRVRSSHDFDAEFHLQNATETLRVKEGRGTFRKFELIGRPPRTLLIHVQRKTAGMGLFSKQNTLVEFPAFFDLREFCLFSQSLPAGAMCGLEGKEEGEEGDVHRRLKRVASWKAEMKNPADEATISMLDAYFKPGGEQAGRRSRSGSFESVGSVYEVKSEADLSFSEGEDGGEYNDDEEEEEWMQDSQAIHPYVRKGALRGGGAPLLYEMVSVIHHLGLGMGGHYVCYRRVRTDEGTKWYLMNDQIVREVSWEKVNTEHMYM